MSEASPELTEAMLVDDDKIAADAGFLDDLRAASSFMTFLLTAGQEVPDATIQQVNQLLSVFAADLDGSFARVVPPLAMAG